MNELVLVNNQQLVTTYDEVERAAKAMAGSGFFADTRQASQAIVKIMAGAELGVGPFAAMVGVNIIQGKPTFSANLMAAAVKRSGHYNYIVTALSDKECTIEFMERFDGKWRTSGVSSFTLEDARKAGTKNLDKFARNMLFARAMSNGVRWYCPDVMNGSPAYTPEELGADVDMDGNVVQGEVVESVFKPANPEVNSDVNDEPVEPQPAIETGDPMTLEAACAMTNSSGVQYGSMPAGVLEKIISNLYKTLNTAGLADEDKAVAERKVAAAKIVYDSKKAQEIP